MKVYIIKIILRALLGNAGVRALLIKETKVVVKKVLKDGEEVESPNVIEEGEISVEDLKRGDDDVENKKPSKLGKNASIAAVIAAILAAVASYEGNTNFGVQEKSGVELYLMSATEFKLMGNEEVSPGDRLLKITWKNGQTILKLEILTIGEASLLASTSQGKEGVLGSNKNSKKEQLEQSSDETEVSSSATVVVPGSNSLATIPDKPSKSENPFK